MPSFTTLYRAIVLVASGVIVVKGWQLYGPTTEQMKSFAVRGVEMADNAWNRVQPSEDKAAASNDPRLSAAPLAAPAAASMVEPAPLFPAGSSEAQNVDAIATAPTTRPQSPEVAAAGSLPGGEADRLAPYYSRLEALGVSDHELAPWGSSGEMYRFCCRASLAGMPSLARHFEAVAAEPVLAVEEVVAKIEAWRGTQRDETALR